MKLNQLKTATLLLPLVLLSGCIETKSKHENYSWELATPTPAPQSKEIELKVSKMTEQDFDAHNDYLLNLALNRHLAAFTVPVEYASNVEIKRWHHNTNSYDQLDLHSYSLGTAGSWISDEINVSGYTLETQEYTYQISYGNAQTKEFRVSIKPDLRINGIVHAADLRTRNLTLDLDTVYIGPNSALITDGRPLRLNAKKLVSRGGIYTDEALAGPGFHTGTIGGMIKLDIESIYGTLDVSVGHKDALSNRIQINAKELAPWRPNESCGISTSMISGYSEPRISIERNRCTGQ